MPSPPTQGRELSHAENEAMIAGWRAFRKRERKDAIRPEPRIDGRSWQDGFLTAKDFYTAACPQQTDQLALTREEAVALRAYVQGDSFDVKQIDSFMKKVGEEP